MFQLVEKRRRYFVISAIAIGAGLLLMALATLRHGAPLQLDIDFLGGSVYQFEFQPGAGAGRERKSVARRLCPLRRG